MKATDPERDLASAYAPLAARAGLNALWALDDRLARVVDTAREPMIAQMRMTWWHEALTRLDTAPPPAEPVLQALAATVVAHGVGGGALARVVEGWEELLQEDPALDQYAQGRGGGLFAAAAGVLGATSDPVEQAGRGWALVDLARNRANPRGLELAGTLLAATTIRWSVAGRPLGMLAKLARRDVARGLERQGSPARLLAMAGHRLTGR